MGAATVHILHDINAVLNDGLQNGSTKMEHERSKGHKARTDIRLTFHHSQSEPQVFAILELKALDLTDGLSEAVDSIFFSCYYPGSTVCLCPCVRSIECSSSMLIYKQNRVHRKLLLRKEGPVR